MTTERCDECAWTLVAGGECRLSYGNARGQQLRSADDPCTLSPKAERHTSLALELPSDGSSRRAGLASDVFEWTLSRQIGKHGLCHLARSAVGRQRKLEKRIGCVCKLLHQQRQQAASSIVTLTTFSSASDCAKELAQKRRDAQDRRPAVEAIRKSPFKIDRLKGNRRANFHGMIHPGREPQSLSTRHEPRSTSGGRMHRPICRKQELCFGMRMHRGFMPCRQRIPIRMDAA